MANQHIIELNGKRYDALSGKMVVDQAAQPKPTHHHAAATTTKGTNLDGFAARPQRPRLARSATPPAQRRPQASKTLMRKSVKRPQPIIKQAAPHPSTPVPVATIQTAKHSWTSPDRLARAQQVPQSKLISKFSNGEPRATGRATVLPLQVAAAPATTGIGKVAGQTLPSPLQKALEQATSHQQPRLKKPRLHHRVAKKLRVSPRLVSVGSVALAVLLIGGFIAYQNVPNLAMRVASARAGVHASLPGYKPAGFGFQGPIQYKPGQITVNFRSNTSDDRNFSITQSASQWNSQTLLQDYVIPTGKSYQTYEEKGKTIYIYGGSNATWVDGGIWYNVQGNSSLNTDQLLRLADSI